MVRMRQKVNGSDGSIVIVELASIKETVAASEALHLSFTFMTHSDCAF